MKVFLEKEENYTKIGVYQIKNLVNNKIYVGSTGDSFKTRWKTHLKKLRSNTHHNTHLQNAYNKYGDDNFKITIIEITQSREEALLREQYYLDLYKSYDPNIGYNIEIDVTKATISEEVKKKISKTLKDKYTNGEIIITTKFKKGNIPWNKGLKCDNISKTRREKFDSIEVYDKNMNLIVTFRSCIDLVEWSENPENIIPGLVI